MTAQLRPAAAPRPAWLRGDLDPALLPRLKAAGIKIVGQFYRPYWERWVYRLEANWNGKGKRCLDKFAEGVLATVEAMEREL